MAEDPSHPPPSGGATCPVCKTPLPPGSLECPTCGLPKELWPSATKQGKAGGDLDDVFTELLKDVGDLGGATPRVPGERPAEPIAAAREEEVEEDVAAAAPVPGRKLRKLEPVVVAPLPSPEGLALPAMMDQVSAWIQVGRRAGFDMSAFTPTASRVAGLVRSGAAEDARATLLDLRERVYHAITDRFSGRVESLEMSIERVRTFLRVDQAQQYLQKTRAALVKGDLETGQRELRRLEGEVNSMMEDLGSLGQTLEQVDLLTQEVELLGGDATQPLLFQGKAFDAIRAGDRRKAEGLLTSASAMLLDALAPLMGQELVRMTDRVKKLRTKGKDIRAAVALIRAITVELKTRNYSRAVATISRLREEIGEEEPAATEGKGSGGEAAAPSAPARVGSPEEVRPGHSYLFLEARAKRGLPAFLRLKGEKEGLFLTTNFPPRLLEESPLPTTRVIWLSESSGWEDTLSPRKLDPDVAERTREFLSKESAGAVGVDGLAYLVAENGMERVERFLKALLDACAARQVGVVASLPPNGLDAQVQARLEALFDATG